MGVAEAASPLPRRVVYIGGLGRSGSTLLELLLGAVSEEMVPAGELRYVWAQGVQENLLCACGRPFRRCDFWRAVGEQAFGGWDSTEARYMVHLATHVDRHRYIPWITMDHAAPRRFTRRLEDYRDGFARLYDAVAAISGRSVVVDSTKDPPAAFIVRGIASVDLRLVHLVRDSRGVAFSWTRRKRRPEVSGHEALMAQYRPLEAALRWLDYNLLYGWIRQLDVDGIVVKYEDLVEKPVETLQRVARHAGEEVPEAVVLDVLNGDSSPARFHSIAGNPLRFDSGPVRLHLDDEWRRAMRRRDRVAVTALTAPLLARYRYSLSC